MRPLLVASSLPLVLAVVATADPGAAPQTPIPPSTAAKMPSATPPPAAPEMTKVPPPATGPEAAAMPPPSAPAAAPEAAKKAQSPPSADAKPKAGAKAKADAKAKTDAGTSPAEMRKASDTYLKQCLEDWDAGTHMTRAEWDRTCRRVARSRVQFMLEQMDK